MSLDHDGRVQLAVGSVSLRDQGLYKCVATNEVGRSEANVRVIVQAKFGSKIDSVTENETQALKVIPEKAIA